MFAKIIAAVKAFFARLFGTGASAAPAQKLVVIPQVRAEGETKYLDAYSLRPGMWVKTAKDDVGIVRGAAVDGSGVVEVAHVNEDGTTKVHERHQIGTLTQAHIEDIPHQRRGEEHKLEALGYKHK